MSGKISLDDYKRWKQRKPFSFERALIPILPIMVVLVILGIGVSYIFTAPPQAASASENMDTGTIMLINGNTDSPTHYLVYVDSVKIGQGILGVGQNITLDISVPSKNFHYIMVSSGDSALTFLRNTQSFPKDFTIMLAPHMVYQVI